MLKDLVQGPFTDNDVKEELSYAYVHAVAAAAGFGCDGVRKDRGSVDVTIRAYGRIVPDGIARPSIELQLKATSAVVIDAGDTEFQFPLPMKNYHDLRLPSQAPTLLVVLIMPKPKKSWLEGNHEGLITRHCAYWCNLLHAPDCNNQKSRTVTIKLKNQFDVKSLKRMMVMAARQKDIGYEF